MLCSGYCVYVGTLKVNTKLYKKYFVYIIVIGGELLT